MFKAQRAWLAISIFAASCASIPAISPNMPAALTNTERAGTLGVPYSGVIESSGSVVLAEAPIKAGEPLLKLPFKYRYTAVLTEDVKGFSFSVRGILAPAGSPGYYAGSFNTSISGGLLVPTVGPTQDLWCFMPKAAGGKRENLCLLRGEGPLASIAPPRLNPYLWSSYAPISGTPDWASTPVFERRNIEIPADLLLEYRFAGISDNAIKLREYAGGKFVHQIELSKDFSDHGILRTVAGSFDIETDSASEQARIRVAN